ncbi:MAG: UDP-N-acetylmuramoyl-L-alanyl-D-glutamate--2,6-diaminopimelate ligase [Kiritimatiellae bacterium]|nr:UDP-N-acetylmuramoyl-L-alanyl-D-glutamate--2,6-diaminopimelate ligase [Kiritimatiellia bacterium]
MKLERIVRGVETRQVQGALTGEITGVAYDSRQVRPGFLFAALRGEKNDGHAFIEDAIKRGAAAIVAERVEPGGGGVTRIEVADARRALAQIACAYNGHPSHHMRVMGVTGTNGKTTVSFMVRDILSSANLQPGLIGTVNYEIGARAIPAARTTPEAPDLQGMLAQMVQVGCKSAVMEVSSHALQQDRVWGTRFDVAVFTNLTRDHLDYHKTMDGYFDAKRLLFRPDYLGGERPAAVVNMDDPWGARLLAGNELAFLPPDRILSYGSGPEATVHAENIDVTPRGSSFKVCSPWGEGHVKLRLLGRYNIANALGAFAAAGALGIEPALIRHVLSSIVFVRGRLEEVPTRTGFQVFIDYAHTDDALENVLTTLREIARRHLIVVFGCGGNRDRSKRPAMGAVADRLADHTILTSDNPRGEEPGLIIDEIRSGFESGHDVEVVEDRRAAIERALGTAGKGDIVLIAGKGHENYQEFANKVIPFDDRQVVRELLR